MVRRAALVFVALLSTLAPVSGADVCVKQYGRASPTGPTCGSEKASRDVTVGQCYHTFQAGARNYYEIVESVTATDATKSLYSDQTHPNCTGFKIATNTVPFGQCLTQMYMGQTSEKYFPGVCATAGEGRAPGPAPGKNIVQLAQSVPDLATLSSALTAGELTKTLSSKGPFTVFAPTNEAFAKLPAATLAHLLDPVNIKELQAILEYHVISGAAVFSKDLKTYQMVKTVEGDEVKIVKAGRVIVNNATVTSADNVASNGIVHIIDSVLSPPPCTKKSCVFSYINPPNISYGRCGQIDMAGHIPSDLWADQEVVDEYVAVTLKYYRPSGIQLQQTGCPATYKKPQYPDVRPVYGIIDYATPALLNATCAAKCNCKTPDCRDKPDDPQAHSYCSLCSIEYNHKMAVFFFYPQV